MGVRVASRLHELSIFFPCYNEAANLPALVHDALSAAPSLADRFELVIVDDGSRDETATIARDLAAANPGVVRFVQHEQNLGYGAALRSGFSAARFSWIAFTDGDCQFRIADLARLIDVADRATPSVVVGFRIRRADPLLRLAYAAVYRFANRVWFGLNLRDVDCAMKLFRSSALQGVRVASDGAFFSAELMIKLRRRGVLVREVGVPHHPRTKGMPSGARLSVVTRAVRDFWRLRLNLWRNKKAALASGRLLRED